MSFCPSSIRCPSGGHILKTEQDRRIVTMHRPLKIEVYVTMEHYTEVGTADSAASPSVRYSGFK